MKIVLYVKCVTNNALTANLHHLIAALAQPMEPMNLSWTEVLVWMLYPAQQELMDSLHLISVKLATPVVLLVREIRTIAPLVSLACLSCPISAM